ncbi:MAG TPA: MoaD/ThiS family protein [Acidobacteriota bacterium]|jgi:molybdopterin converting factor subunit 1|nr:MoaD/ThiS family protein [Acidobacteriota bacterium]
MKLQVLLFATFADIAGSRKITLEVDPPCTAASLVRALQEKFSMLRGYDLQRILVAVNQEMAAPDQIISGDDEVGVFPPVSGG